MKYYPYILSEQRLSLLSPEERRQYDFEHSDYCDWNLKEEALKKAGLTESYDMIKNKYLNEMMESESFSNETEQSIDEMADQMAQFESEYIINEVYDILDSMMKENVITSDEYNNIIESAKNKLYGNTQALNEATDGPDMTWWAKGIGVTLAPLLSGMGLLLLAGKTDAAINALKKYMNKIVEEVDDGTYKKQGFFKKFLNRITPDKLKNLKVKWFGGPKDIGATSEDKSKSSFRELQEVYEGNIACKQMILMKNIGLLPDDYNQALYAIENNKFEDGGFNTFIEIISKPLSGLCNKI
ncbi:MAG: hypothetical protein [Wendovervirus sonii]|uniref:Pre-toxin TG domain-containing protein n=1 Tax=phage Lak_Megaphage_Sonny TaxID=3109229 RepID=A0ABZ0Z5H1_9CAUD|nr:MAG: hypothetical protein [phage Lak_Megaphage_Sonny]